VLADGVVVGRIMKANAASVDAPWLWTPAEKKPDWSSFSRAKILTAG
jgi:hypothetical protein